MKIIGLVFIFFLTLTASAEDLAPKDGEVRIPLNVYTHIVDGIRGKTPKPAPYAIGKSDILVNIKDGTNAYVAEVIANVTVETFEESWVQIPLLPSSTPLTNATINGEPIQLVQGPYGLSWNTKQVGKHSIQLAYPIDARLSETGFFLPIPVSQSAATHITVNFPSDSLNAAIVPAVNTNIEKQNGITTISANVPATSSIMVTWSTSTKRPFATSRAEYIGEVNNDALAINASFEVEVFTNDEITLPLIPANITLNGLLIDGKSASVYKEGAQFATRIRGKGLHKIALTFDVPVNTGSGLPNVNLNIPEVPVSKFEITLPGKQQLKITPQANIRSAFLNDTTTATVYIPVTNSVSLSWTEALPENLRDEVRANANLYHSISAEEGVLHGRAFVVYDITQGETNQVSLTIPAYAQVNRITSGDGIVSDWAAARTEDGKNKNINVFLNHAVKEELQIIVDYEVLLTGHNQSDTALLVPVVTALDVHRQRGMIALLTGSELTLKPETEERVTRVGENQIPAFVRNLLQAPVAHTYKYIDQSPSLLVTTEVPERKQGKFDAQVDTLISIGEVTMKGSATIEVDVKSGAISELALTLPQDINVLSVSGPSLRKHEIVSDDDVQHIAIEFTQEMEGQFRLEVNYEQITGEAVTDATVPTITVDGAEVEHGRIAVEALTAVEVQASTTEQLSNLEINELPQQLVLKTTNPILLSYKYVHAKPPFRLDLTITRHKEIDVQVAAIEHAQYQTLFTRDGLAVTTARFMVRNSRRQFLRLQLPANSQVWSVFANEQPEKPAHAADQDKKDAILIKMINSAVGFPVEVVYATPVKKMGFQGVVSSYLPRPDMIVTKSRWDVFLPTKNTYKVPTTSMDVIVHGRWANPQELTKQAQLMTHQKSNLQLAGQPLRITVPTQGIHFAFEKLYANQSTDEAEFSIRYVSSDGNRVGAILCVIGVLLTWFGILAIGFARLKCPRNIAIGSIITGVSFLIMAIGYFNTGYALASVLSLLIALVLAILLLGNKIRDWMATRKLERLEKETSSKE